MSHSPADVRAYALTTDQQHARLAYGRGHFLIRPDGYVAAAWGGEAAPPQGLAARFGLRRQGVTR